MNKNIGARKIMLQGMGQGLTPKLSVDGGMWPPRQTHRGEAIRGWGCQVPWVAQLRCHIAILVSESSRDTSNSPVSPTH